MVYLLLDVGSTFIKYSFYDESSKTILQSDKYPFPDSNVDDGKLFSVSLLKLNKIIFDVFLRAKVNGCGKAFICVQMHGFVLRDTDGHFGDYISWRDNSGDTASTAIKAIDFNLMGTSLKNNLPLAKLAFRNLEGEFFTLGSYIAWLLTQNNATHITDACASGFFYADTGEYNQYAGSLKMPTACKSISIVGNYNGILIYTPIGDHQASFLGSGAQLNKYLLNIGTATQISCLSDASFADGEYEKRPYFDEKRLYTISGLIGGDRLFEGKGWEELFDQVINAIKKLPPKDKIVIGGGGSCRIYSYLTSRFEKLGIECDHAENNIGMEGLKMIADLTDSKKIEVGTMLSEVCFSNFPVIAKNSGLDFVIVDNEHGYFDYSDIAQLAIKATLIGIDMIVRIGDSSRGHITKLADMGVNAFLLPMTNTPEDIERVIQYAKYPPIGERGVSTTRVHTLYNPPPLQDYMNIANQKMRIYAQIETVKGIKNIKKILADPQVSGIFIGPNDLSVDMNSINDKTAILQAVAQIIEAANDVGKPCGIITGDKTLIDASISYGIKMISKGSELNMLINGCKNIKEGIIGG